MKQFLSFEYIRGLIDGEGSFTFCTAPNKKMGSIRIPAFQLRMHARDQVLVEEVRNRLKLNNKVHKYHYPGKDGSKRGPQVMLIVRDFASLRDIIIPLFYKSLYGNKGAQFEKWIEIMGSEPSVPREYKLLNKLYNNGYFEDKSKKYI